MKHCKGRCILETDQPDTDCRDLTWYLDRIEEQALYRKAQELLSQAASQNQRAANASSVEEEEAASREAGVLAYASDKVNPYERRPSGHLVFKVTGDPVARFPGDGLD